MYHHGITLPPLKITSARSPTSLSNTSITLSTQTYSSESNFAWTKPTKTSKCAKSSGPPSKHTNSSGPPSKCTKSFASKHTNSSGLLLNVLSHFLLNILIHLVLLLNVLSHLLLNIIIHLVFLLNLQSPDRVKEGSKKLALLMRQK